ncbi:MAG: hypothetical protein R2729_15045 [Bryobacteraceae bacterium]
MNLIPLVAIWAVMAVAVLALAVIRMMSASHEDDTIHLREGDAGVIRQQDAYASRIAWMDRWGKTLTIVTVAYGLVLVGVYFYQLWMESTRVIAQ